MMSRTGQNEPADARPPIPDRLIRPVEMRAVGLGDGAVFTPHVHDWGQFTYSAEGVLTVLTPEGRFTAPPAMAVWIPPGIRHDIRPAGPAKFRSLYLDAAYAAGMPGQCTVLSVDPLLRQLILAAAELPRAWDPHGTDGRLMTVLVDRIRAAPPAELSLPLPTDPRLRTVTDALLADPADPRGLSEFATSAGAAPRTLARLFRRETGLSFRAWRRQRVLLAALERLAEGQSVTGVALDLGYDSPSAFIAMFRKALGTPPSRYLARG
jgi:AraC-like DNA-binding protein